MRSDESLNGDNQRDFTVCDGRKSPLEGFNER